MLKSLLSHVLLVAALAALSDTAHAAPPPGVTTFTARLADSNGPLTGSHNFAFGIYADPTGGSALWTETHSSVVLDQGLASIALGSMTPLTTTLFDGSTRYLEVIVDGSALDARVPIHSVPYALRAGVASVAESLAPSLQSQLDMDYLPLGSSLSCNAGQAVTGLGANGSVVCGGVQTPLAAGCSAGQFLTSFSAAGVASCSADGKGVAAIGGGLTGTAVGNDIELAIAMNAINNAHIINGTILGEDIAANAIDGTKVLDGSLTGADVLDGSLTGADILNGSIAGGDIATDSIGAGHLLANSVASSEIVDASITSTELAAGACDTTQLATNAVTNAKMADNAIGAAEVINNSLGYDDIDAPMFNSYINLVDSVALVSGDNDIFVPGTFAATSAGRCLVTAQVRLTNAAAAASGGASLRVIYRQTGMATSNDGTWATYAGPYGGTLGFSTVQKTVALTLTSAATYELGCRVNASGDWIGDTAICQVTAFCL